MPNRFGQLPFDAKRDHQEPTLNDPPRRRASDAFEHKVEVVFRIVFDLPRAKLPLSYSKHEAYADEIDAVRRALREIGV